MSLRTSQWSNANVLFDANRHVGHAAGRCSQDGRISLPNNNPNAPSGLTIRGSLFASGGSDGILNGSNGTVIEGNTFQDLEEGGAHTDAIQLFGALNTTIRRNMFYDVTICLMSPDGGRNITFTDNVCVQAGPDGAFGLLLGRLIRPSCEQRPAACPT